MKTKIILFFWLTIVLISCDVKPREINYGHDHCYHCDMTVVDKNYAAEYVTKKGKTYVFDAVECLVMKMKSENNESLMAFILVADFNHPNNLIPAKTAIYLISKEIKSPMGANLSALSTREDAEKLQQEKGGELFTWSELKIKLSH